MATPTAFNAMPLWLAGDTPEADVAVLSICTLSRNLADLPFPARCSEADLLEVEARVLRALDGFGMLSNGHYFSLPAIGSREIRLLAERKLITRELAAGTGPRGVYVSDDQTYCIMLNGVDHVTTRAMVSGLQPREAWARLNLLDDTLSGVLDFAFHKERGYLTADFEGLGTGLRSSVLLHLPATSHGSGRPVSELDDCIALHGVRAGGKSLLPERKQPPGEAVKDVETSGHHVMSEAIAARYMAEQAHYSDLSGAEAVPRKETLGDLFLLTHRGALGASEDEMVYRVRKAAEGLIQEERATRETMVRESHWFLEDRVGRAKGLSAGVHLLTYSEALAILSSMRLGVALDLVPGHGVQEMNEVLLTCQGAHLEMAKGRSFDMFELSRERAALFRARFT